MAAVQQRWGQGDTVPAARGRKGKGKGKGSGKGGEATKRKAEDVVASYLSLTAQEAFSRLSKGEKRPFMASECKDLRDCERFRMQIVGEIVRKVGELQNNSLGELRIRELNDEVNKIIREKGHWQRQIIELGGPNYFIGGGDRDQFDQLGGVKAHGGGGYLYFGAAKSLPGVRELFESAAVGPQKRSRSELFKSITPAYYGFGEEEGEALLRAERKAEAKARQRMISSQGKKETYYHDLFTPEEEEAALSQISKEEQRGDGV
eukprot:Hpha_TRINITY_DN1256_c0_g1::TRINITY_DN1256_c0_g1_i1::g.44880::m.44880/K12870/ISY1; pre-mRNA-splicing factor ISY1